MLKPQIKIDKELKALCPNLVLNCLACELLVQPSTKAFQDYFKTTIQNIATGLILENINTLPAIKASRKAFKYLGKDPARYRLSAEALLRRVASGKELYRVNNVVDILNLISIESGFSIGGYDASTISGDIHCGIGRENEIYQAIGRGELNIDRMSVLRDNLGAFGSPVSDSQRTRITENTKHFLMVFFNFSGDEKIIPWIKKAEDLLKKYANAPLFDYRVLT